MASLLTTHLEQISLCATSIAELPFPGPGKFTNALLTVSSADITSLIRDTEQHERALFHLAPPPLPNTKFGAQTSAQDFAGGVGVGGGPGGRRKTVFPGASSARQPKNKAVAAVLGGDLYARTRNTDANGGGRQAQRGGEMDVEVLLRGAEKLAAVYPIPGANDKITALRRRHQQLEANIAHYEGRVAEQTRELMKMSRPKDRSGYYNDDEETQVDVKVIPLTKEDLEKEDEEVRELERKKKGLEERVEGMERDLGGLMR